jgi:hypothetical protein
MATLPRIRSDPNHSQVCCGHLLSQARATAAKNHRSIPWATTKTLIRSSRGKSNLENSITIQATCPERQQVQKKMSLMSLGRNPPLIRAALIVKPNKASDYQGLACVATLDCPVNPPQ